jgi:hypothetical protein
MKKIVILALMLLPLLSYGQQAAQDEKTVKDQEKKFQESVDKQIEDMQSSYKLEDWQVFYVDSILNHDYSSMRAELKALSDAKFGNEDAYYSVQDKWMERIYNSLHKVLNQTQWNKYLKSGAARDKRTRDKRAEKNK